MNIVREITKRYVDALPAEKKYVTPDELESAGFPDFVVERISYALTQNLADSIVPPTTDWANMQTEPVAEAWEAFLEAIHAETRLPVSFAESVIEAAVADIVDILTEPRKNLPDYIFATETTLDIEQISQRAASIVVYKHFGTAIIRFMQKKGLTELEKDRCAKLIAIVDEKLTDRYSSLNWAVLLDPWFDLMGDQIEADLLRRFFADKNLNRMAERFDQEQKPVTRSRFIEIMSRPDLLHGEEEYDLSRAKTEEDRIKSESDSNDETPLLHLASSKAKQENEDEEDEPILNKYNIQEEDEDEGPKLAELKADDDNEDGEDIPMWQRFMPEDEDSEEQEEEIESNETSEEKSEEEPEEEDEEELGEPLDTEPIIDLTKPDPKEETNHNLHKLLRDVDDQKDYFVDELFGGDENAFYSAMEEIAAFDDWSQTARYITSEIFRRNMVDLYSDVAVDFTDRLQNYFLEKTKD